jgi:hypothetical protein
MMVSKAIEEKDDGMDFIDWRLLFLMDVGLISGSVHSFDYALRLWLGRRF